MATGYAQNPVAFTIAGQVLPLRSTLMPVKATAVIDYSESKGVPRLVLFAIADGRQADESIAEFANIDEAEVEDAVDTLIDLREVRITQEGRYQITLP
jgi:hypothetical protein